MTEAEKHHHLALEYLEQLQPEPRKHRSWSNIAYHADGLLEQAQIAHAEVDRLRTELAKLRNPAELIEVDERTVETITVEGWGRNVIRPEEPVNGLVIQDKILIGGKSAIELESGGRGVVVRNVTTRGHVKYAIAANTPVDGLTIAGCDLGPGLPYDKAAEKSGKKPRAEATIRVYGDWLVILDTIIRGIHPLKAPVRIGAGRYKIILRLTVRSTPATEHHGSVALYPHTNPESSDPAERIEFVFAKLLDLDAPLYIGPNVSDVYIDDMVVSDDAKWAVILEGPDRHNERSKFDTHEPPRRINLPESCRGRVLATSGAVMSEVSYH